MDELQQAESLSLKNILKDLYYSRYLIFSSVLAISLISIALAFNSENVYRSESYLKLSDNPSNFMDQSPLNEAAGGISSILGLGLASSDKLVISTMKKIESRSFLKLLISNNPSFQKKLFASDSYNASTKKIKYDSNLYDESKDEWVKEEPKFFKVYDKYKKSLRLEIEQDSSLLSISFEHVSPFFAKEAVEQIIGDINILERNRALENSEKTLFFLNQEMTKNQNLLVKKNISSLAEKELNKKMFAEVHTSEFLFRIVEPPFLPEEKIRPNRALYLIFGIIFGFLVGVFLSTLKNSFKR